MDSLTKPLEKAFGDQNAATSRLSAILDGLAARSSEKLDWRDSIVDLMKLLGMDSSLANREQLATALRFFGDFSDKAMMHIFLHNRIILNIVKNHAVDVVEILDGLAAKKPERHVVEVLECIAPRNSEVLDWRNSVVDLMKLFGMRSSLEDRIQLASQLGFTLELSGSGTMNMWLHARLIISIVDNGGKLPKKSLKRSPATRVQDLCRTLKIKEGILPAIAIVWDRHEARKPSRNEFEAAIYTVFDNLEPEQHKGMSVAFAGYGKLRSDRTAECFFDDRLADTVRSRALEKADFIRQFMHEGVEFAGKQLYPGSGGVPGPGQVRLWKTPVDPEGPADLGPWPWLTAIRTDPAGTNEFGNLESFLPVPPQTGEVPPLDYQFAQECRFEPDVSGGIIARCDRLHPTGGGPLFPVPCPGGPSYTFRNDCLRIPSQRAGGSIRLRGFNFITPSVKVHLRSQDHPPLTPISQECIVYGDREIAAKDEQGKVIADLRVRDWVEVPIPKEHPERPGTPLAPGLYELSITVSEPSATGAPIVRNSNKLLLRIEPNENVRFLLRSERGRCITETPGAGDDEIWWDAFVGHLVADSPLDTEQATGVEIKDISRQPFPRAPWEDMDDGKSAKYVCNIFDGPFGLNGVVAVAIVGFEIDSESAARDQLQGFWNAYFEALKSIAELAVSGIGLGVSLAGLIGGPVALAAAAAIAAYIGGLTLVALGFWAVWAPADLIALDIFVLDGMSSWDKTDAKRPLPGESVRQLGGEFDDNSVLVRTTQRPMPRKGRPGELVATWVQENQYDAHHDGDLFARYALEFRLTRTSV